MQVNFDWLLMEVLTGYQRDEAGELLRSAKHQAEPEDVAQVEKTRSALALAEDVAVRFIESGQRICDLCTAGGGEHDKDCPLAAYLKAREKSE